MNAGALEQVPLGVEQAFGDLESRIMQDVVRRIRINGFVTRSADWQISRLRQLGESNAYIKQQIQMALKLSDVAIDNIYTDAIGREYIQNASLYELTGASLPALADNRELQSLMSAVKKQTKGELTNITKSMGFVTQEGGKLKALDLTTFYQKTLDHAIGDITTGAFDYNTALKRTISQMTNSGLRWIDYSSGYHSRVVVSARRAVMSGFSQVMTQMNQKVADDLGTDSFEVTWHAGARETHQWFAGKVFTKVQLIEQCGLGTVEGLKGANCMHDYISFVPGASVRTYTDAQLEKMNAEENTPKTFRGKEYTTSEALQRQRQLETNMRAQRQEISLLKQGGGDPKDIQNATSKYRVTSAEYTGLSKELKLPEQRERVTMDGLGNVTKGKKAVDGEATGLNVLRAGSAQGNAGIQSTLQVHGRGTDVRTDVGAAGYRNMSAAKTYTLRNSASDFEYNLDYSDYTSPSGKEFRNSFNKAIQNSDHKAFVEVHDEAFYNSSKNLLSKDGMSGVAITPDGNIASVYNASARRGETDRLMPYALSNGGVKLDNFDGGLSDIYERYGFEPVSKTKFMEEFAPADWNYERDGKPDIIFWKHNGENVAQVMEKRVNKTYARYDLSKVPDLGSYDEAEKYRDKLIKENT